MAAALPLPPLAWIPGTTFWIVVWSLLGAATVVLVVLMRTRWRETKPWKKCALLSAWVHVLLACVATNVRIGAGGAGVGIGPGAGGPIRVAIVNVAPARDAIEATFISPPVPTPVSRDAEGPPEAERSEPKPEIELAAAEPAPPTEPKPDPAPATTTPAPDPLQLATLAPPSLAPLLPAPDLTLEAPELLPQPEPEPEVPAAEVIAEVAPRVMDGESEVEGQSVAVAKLQAEAGVASEGGAPSNTGQVAEATMLPDTAGALVDPNATPQSGMPAAYANRFADRAATVAGGGGNPTTERAVQSALAWLAASQSPDGRWDPKRFGAGQERFVLGENRGAAGAQADTGVTALALLAFLGAGHSHQHGPYADNVARALDYLRRSQGANGNLGGDAEFFAHMYCHSMATFAVSEACAMTRDPKLKPIVERAVAYSLAAQHPTDGGWRYKAQPGNDGGDTSQLGWQLMSLRSAELAGVGVPPATWSRVDTFLANVERGANGGLAAYRPEGAPSRAMTAEALFCRQLLTHRADGGLAPAALDEARRALLEETPGGITVNFYYWYYGTIALHRAKEHSIASEEAWKTWNESLAKTLVNSQSGDGSWTSACVWGGYGGRVYTTALATMCLEVYYRYTPEDYDPSMARRSEWQAVPAR